MRMLACTIVLVCAGCAPTLISLGSAVPLTDTTPREFRSRSSRARRRPIRCRSSAARARFGDVEVSLGHAVSTAAVPWADAHRGQRPDGWQLHRRAGAGARRAQPTASSTVALNVRATLRTRVGHGYLAQTQAHCNRARSRCRRRPRRRSSTTA